MHDVADDTVGTRWPGLRAELVVSADVQDLAGGADAEDMAWSVYQPEHAEAGSVGVDMLAPRMLAVMTEGAVLATARLMERSEPLAISPRQSP